MKIKIFGFNGSNRGSKSITNYYYKSVIQQLEKKYEVESILRDSKNTNIKFCVGCHACFNSLKFTCINDDMELVRKELIEADIIFLMSPVFVHNVSGSMKVFLDKIAKWTHLMALTGKLGVIVSVSSSNGNEFVGEYLHKMSDFLGLLTIQNLSLSNLSSLSEQMLKKTITSYAKDTVRKISKFIEDKNYEDLISNRQLEHFDMYRSAYKYTIEKPENIKEYQYWKEILSHYDTFNDYFLSKINLID